MDETLKQFIVIAGASTPVVGVIMYFLSKLLSSRKEIWELQRNDEEHDKEIAEIKKDMEKIERWYNNDREN